MKIIINNNLNNNNHYYSISIDGFSRFNYIPTFILLIYEMKVFKLQLESILAISTLSLHLLQ